MNNNYARSFYFWPTFVLASFFVALLIQLFNHNPINVDGILYIEVARFYAEHGLHAAMSLYPWPFYSIILFHLSQWLHLDLLHTAFWFNNILITLAITFWVALLKEFNPSTTIIGWGILLILIFPSLNHLRAFIIRDAGYWAFLFAGMWCLFQSLKNPRFLYVFLYSLFLLIATLFRIEGAVVWVAAPFIFLLIKNKKIDFFKHQILFLVIIVGLLFWKMSNHQHHFSQLGRVHDFWQIFESHAQGFTLDFLHDVIDSTTPLYGLLAIYGFTKVPASPQKKLYVWLLLILFAIPLIFAFQSGISTERYILPFSLLFILMAPFALPHFSKLTLSLIIVILSIMAYGSIIPFGTSKVYLADAGLWLKTHATPADKIYTNSREVLFYAGHSTIDWQFDGTPDKMLPSLTNSGWKSYNYLAIRLDKNNAKILQHWVDQLPMQPIKIFRNKRDDKVMIFYVSH